MSFPAPPAGDRIRVDQGELQVPDRPVIPFVEGDGIGPDIWAATRRVLDAAVEKIEGLGPAVSVGQNLLNRNPGSIVATAAGLHPFLRLLYSRFGKRKCPECGEEFRLSNTDELARTVEARSIASAIDIYVPVVLDAPGSHRTLICLLAEEFGAEALRVDGEFLDETPKPTTEPRSIMLFRTARTSSCCWPPKARCKCRTYRFSRSAKSRIPGSI